MRYVLLTRFSEGYNDQWQVQLQSDDHGRMSRAKASAESYGMLARIVDTEV